MTSARVARGQAAEGGLVAVVENSPASGLENAKARGIAKKESVLHRR